jgi:hypothetical protein
MRSVLLALLLLVGCGGGSKEDRCTRVRDKVAPELEKNVKDAIASVDPEHRAELEAEAAKEMAAFHANFVKVCAAQDDATMKCLEEGAQTPSAKPSKDCRDKTEPLWDAIYTK